MTDDITIFIAGLVFGAFAMGVIDFLVICPARCAYWMCGIP